MQILTQVFFCRPTKTKPGRIFIKSATYSDRGFSQRPIELPQRPSVAIPTILEDFKTKVRNDFDYVVCHFHHQGQIEVTHLVFQELLDETF